MKKFIMFLQAVIVLKQSKKAGTHLHYVCNTYTQFQFDRSKTVEGVDYTNLSSCSRHFSKKKKTHTHTHTHTHKKKPKFEKAVIFVMNFFPKRQTYNYSVPVSFMPSNKSVAQKV